MIKVTGRKLLFVSPAVAVIQPKSSIKISISHYPVSNSKNNLTDKHKMHIMITYAKYSDIQTSKIKNIFESIEKSEIQDR